MRNSDEPWESRFGVEVTQVVRGRYRSVRNRLSLFQWYDFRAELDLKFRGISGTEMGEVRVSDDSEVVLRSKRNSCPTKPPEKIPRL